MIVYKKEWLDNLAIRKATTRWHKQGMIPFETQEEIMKNYPTEYKKWGIFARIGMFIFTIIILSSAFGLISLFMSDHWSESRLRGELWFYGIAYYIVAEYFVRENKFVFSGVIDALIYAAVFCLEFALIMSIQDRDSHWEPVFIAIIMFPFIAIPAVRFADALLTLAAFICLLTINVLAIFRLGAIGKTILPFESMGVSYLFYYLIIKLKNKEGLHYWKNCFTVIETGSLIALYLSGNYMIIRQMTESLLDITIGPGQDIALAPLFYAFTFITPLVYLWLGLKRKDHVRTRLGLILLVAGILSVKYYHHLMPPETAMILSGGFMIIAAYLCIKYLKTPRNGITFETDEQSERHQAMVNIANIAISQTMAGQPHPVKPNDTNFGGGDFGGGGAGADF